MNGLKWIKICSDIFDDEKILMIESLPNADNIIVIWFKLLCLAGKSNNSGVFLMNDKIAYSDEMLAAIFRRDVKIVRMALKTFQDFAMIEIINDTVTIPNWSKYQTLDAYEKKKERDRIYQQNRRKKQKLLAEKSKKSSDKSLDPSVDVATLEEDIDKERDIDIDIDINTKVFIEKWNSLGLNKLINIKNKRLKSLKARVKEYGIEKVMEAIDNINQSDFLKGKNDRGWQIDFDWLIKPNNFIKVLENKYKSNEPVIQTNKNDGSNFNNFEPRQYDYEDLEKKLLGWDKDDEENKNAS